jgi:hypothetical protein
MAMPIVRGVAVFRRYLIQKYVAMRSLTLSKMVVKNRADDCHQHSNYGQQDRRSICSRSRPTQSG